VLEIDIELVITSSCQDEGFIVIKILLTGRILNLISFYALYLFPCLLPNAISLSLPINLNLLGGHFGIKYCSSRSCYSLMFNSVLVIMRTY
jgi:hypothetical protein